MLFRSFPDFTWRGNVPVFGHDEALEDELGLPDSVIAVMTSNGVVHKAFNPFSTNPFHSIPTEGLKHD